MLKLKCRPGFAIPTAMLAIAIITIALAASFTLVSAERRTVNDQQLQVRALGIAQQGIEAYLRHPENPAFRPGRTVNMPPLDSDTAWIPVNVATGDTAIVIPRLYRVSTTTAADTMYVISSLGRQGGRTIQGTPPAVRTVAEIVTWTGAVLPLKAGWTSLTGLSKNGAAGTLSGNDAAAPVCTTIGNVAGVSVPLLPGYVGSQAPLQGHPPLDSSSLGLTPQSAADSMAKSGVDWAEWSQGLNLPNVWRTSDHGGAFPSFTNPAYYPTVYVNGDVVMPTGRGMLVVSGNLTINGSTSWDGFVLIGGGVTSNGNNTINGAMISGLNVMLTGISPGPSSIGNGNKTVQFNSCEVKNALAGSKVLVPRHGTWMDNWKTY